MFLPFRLAAIPLALVASLCSVWLMKVLIETRSIEEAFEQPPARIVFISNDLEEMDNPEPPSPHQEEKQEEQEPEREPPPPEKTAPPEPEEVQPAPPAEKAIPVKPAPPKKEQPKKDVAKKAEASPAAAQARFDSSPLYRPKPSYPMHARRSQTEGYVMVRYSIAKSGAVTNVGVISASPPGVFESAALDAVRRWRYQPQPIDRPGMQTRISFVLRGR